MVSVWAQNAAVPRHHWRLRRSSRIRSASSQSTADAARTTSSYRRCSGFGRDRSAMGTRASRAHDGIRGAENPSLFSALVPERGHDGSVFGNSILLLMVIRFVPAVEALLGNISMEEAAECVGYLPTRQYDFKRPKKTVDGNDPRQFSNPHCRF